MKTSAVTKSLTSFGKERTALLMRKELLHWWLLNWTLIRDHRYDFVARSFVRSCTCSLALLCSSVPLFSCFPVPLFPYTPVPLCPCSSVPHFLCFSDRMSICSHVLIVLCSFSVPLFPCSPASLFSCSSVPLFSCYSISLCPCAPVSLFPYPSVPYFLCFSDRMSLRYNIKTRFLTFWVSSGAGRSRQGTSLFHQIVWRKDGCSLRKVSLHANQYFFEFLKNKMLFSRCQTVKNK